MSALRNLGYKTVVYFEKLFKQTLFDCRMCGTCHLSKNGMVCCMTCPKGLRNGPCGGTGIDGMCEVEGIGECVWHKIYRRSGTLHSLQLTEKVKPALDWSLQGTSSYLNLWTGRDGSFEGRGMRWKIKRALGLDRSKSTDASGAGR